MFIYLSIERIRFIQNNIKMFLHIKNEMMNPGVRTVPCRIQAEKTSTLPDVLDIGRSILLETQYRIFATQYRRP